MKNYNFLKLILFAIAISIPTLSYIFNREDNSNSFIVGTASGYAPYVSLDENGEYIGFDIDFATELAKKLNKKLVIRDLGSFSSLFIALEQGKIDAIIWAVSITKDRLKKVDMIYYQGDTTKSLPLIFWKEIPEKIKSINDLANYENNIVCVEPGSTLEHVLSKYDFITPKISEKVIDSIMEIKYGKAIAALVDPSIAKNMKERVPEIQILPVELDESDQAFGNGIVIKKGNNKLLTSLKKATETLIQNGTVKKLEKKWKL